MVLATNGDCCLRLEARLGVASFLLFLWMSPRFRPFLSVWGPPAGLRSRSMSASEVWVTSGGGSSLEEPDPEDSVEIRLTGRWSDDGRSEESEGVADGARSLLLMEAVDRRWDSEGEGVGGWLFNLNIYGCIRKYLKLLRFISMLWLFLTPGLSTPVHPLARHLQNKSFSVQHGSSFIHNSNQSETAPMNPDSDPTQLQVFQIKTCLTPSLEKWNIKPVVNCDTVKQNKEDLFLHCTEPWTEIRNGVDSGQWWKFEVSLVTFNRSLTEPGQNPFYQCS